jgi:hypothetical protein
MGPVVWDAAFCTSFNEIYLQPVAAAAEFLKNRCFKKLAEMLWTFADYYNSFLAEQLEVWRAQIRLITGR